MTQLERRFKTDQFDVPYLLYLPPEYDADTAKKWAFILFLHGAGERGDDLTLLRTQGLAKKLDHDDLPFIVVSPQCPAETWWTDHTDALFALWDDCLTRYQVDSNRVYLTGLSMGGYQAWHMAARHPDKFTAVVPICGGGDVETACNLKSMPIWAFHGEQDSVVPLSTTQDMVDAVNECGGDARLTVYPDLQHDSWTATYANPEVYDWLLSHSLSSRK